MMTQPEIRINTIKEPVCELYDKYGIYIGEIKSLLQMTDIRVQHKEKNIPAGSFYFKYEGTRIDIDSSGELSEYPKGFFDQHSDQLLKLL